MLDGVRRYLSKLGPGLITGASDDDPSGISTYSIAGASTGYSMLWVALLTCPMMAVVQGMCARIGLVTGVGLATTMRRRLSVWLLYPLGISVIVANTINAGADLEGMGAAARLVFGQPRIVWIVLFGAILIVLQVFLSYRLFSAIVKWLTVALFAYVITAFVVHPPWATVLRHLAVPTVIVKSGWLTTLVAVLGTTITPYLFFWQASLEVEEEKQAGKKTEKRRKGATAQEIKDMHADVNGGMIFSNLVAFFIIVTTAATLGAHGTHHIASAEDAARALAPLAGRFASWLFALGMVGTGLLAIPALVASSAYILVGSFGFQQGLDKKPARAPQFYGTLVAGMVVAIVMGLFNIDPIGALFWSAVINGVVAVPILILVVLFASDRGLMGKWTSSLTARIWGWFTVSAMAAAAIAMFAFWGKA
jgi:NRAMP (natural resistance-associated macrophage protein)-like metal ion transporter